MTYAEEKAVRDYQNQQKEIRKAQARGFLLGALVGGTVVACMKNDSDTVKEISRAVISVGTSYYGAKALYNIFNWN